MTKNPYSTKLQATSEALLAERMCLTKERNYAHFSLKIRNRSTAIKQAKFHYHELKLGKLSEKKYFSLTAKIGVEYLGQRNKEVCQANAIVAGRYTTIKTHLEHRLEYIGRDVKLKELERTDCDDVMKRKAFELI